MRLAAIIIFAAFFWGEAKANTDYQIDVVARGLEQPWSLAFLPNGDMLITELVGRLRVIRDGKLIKQPIAGVPRVYFAGQGGLMDVIAHPNYRRNRLIYLSYSGGDGDSNATYVMRARFDGRALTEQKVIFKARPLKATPVHYGGRMAFMPDGTLLVALGDGFDYREEAQNLTNHYGAIVRIRDDGSVPGNNPFVKTPKALPEIWSYGHRNVQAILVDRKGRIFSNEHGPRGGDEVNLIRAGKNYGWPLITYGKDYSGAVISPWTHREGLEQPLWQWTPSIAPSGMAIYEGNLFPQWRGDLFITSLVFGNVQRLDLKEGKIVNREILFKGIDGRLRDIRVGPKGALYLLGGTTGKVYRITPK